MTDLDRLERAGNIVANMPSRYNALTDVVAAGYGSAATERVTTSNVHAPSPANEHVIDMRLNIVNALTSWAQAVADAASFGFRRSGSLVELAGFIIGGWRWVEAATWADQFADAMIDLARQVDDLTAPPERVKIADRIHDGLIDGRDVALATGVSPSMVRQWVADGSLTVQERGPNGRNLYDLDAVRALKVKRDALTAA